ncbi:complement factor H-like isoform X2 [Rhinoraja longicauda]
MTKMELARVVILLGILDSFITLSLSSTDCGSPKHVENSTPILETRSDTYPLGTEITYRCNVGYVGFVRYWCRSGRWQEEVSSAKCRLKSCGSPGDILHGSFHLVRGVDLVFGSRIEYECAEGYQLVGRRNYSNCEVSGWSGIVPFCEVNKCPSVRKPENGKIVGFNVFELNQDFPFGSMLNFECNNPELIIDGAREIYCMKNKSWSHAVPKCKELQCNKPNLENGKVQTHKEIFKAFDQLNYRCNDGFKPGGDLVTTCDRFGWSPVPSCTPIICRKATIEHGEFKGENRMYSHQESVEYTCDNYERTGGGRIRCTAQGWHPIPACPEITCTRPGGRIQLTPYQWRYRLQQDVQYRCARRGSRHRSRCTVNGWHPAIVCPDDPCQRPEINNAVSFYRRQYRHGESLQVNCAHGFKLQGDATIQCRDAEWTFDRSFPACNELGCVEPPTIDNGDFNPKKTRYDQNEVVSYACLEGYYLSGESSLRCDSNGWPDTPKCINMQSRCSDPHPTVEHGITTNKASYKVSYKCRHGYIIDGSEVVICDGGKWSQPPTCSFPPDPELGCDEMPPPLKDGDILDFLVPPILPGQVVTYQCQDYYVLKGNKKVTCSGGKWSKPPQCLVPCILTQEDFNKNSLSLMWRIEKGIDVKHGGVLEFKCSQGFQVEPPARRYCQNGTMEIPKCISDEKKLCFNVANSYCSMRAIREICFQYNIRHMIVDQQG